MNIICVSIAPFIRVGLAPSNRRIKPTTFRLSIVELRCALHSGTIPSPIDTSITTFIQFDVALKTDDSRTFQSVFQLIRSIVLSGNSTTMAAGGLGAVAYHSVFKRFSTTLLALAVGGFAFEFLFNKSTDTLWDSWNRGKQWKDLKLRYANKPDADE